MFENYEIDFGKLNLNWLHSVRIELDEIQELLRQEGRLRRIFDQPGSLNAWAIPTATGNLSRCFSR